MENISIFITFTWVYSLFPDQATHELNIILG